MTNQWQWDESLFRGSARYYLQGRLPYAPTLADRLQETLALDGIGRLLDVGCGPGVLTLPLAHLFAEVIGIDPDREMLDEAERRATEAGMTNIGWRNIRAEQLSPALGSFRVATFGQSFHGMERERVVALVTDVLEPGGAFAHIADRKDPLPDLPLPHPAPPFAAIKELVATYLGPVRRAGASLFPGSSQGNEAAVLASANYPAPERLIIPNIGIIKRTTDDLVAWVFSLSSSAPHLFAKNLSAFERDLRQLLRDASPSGRFAEITPDTEVMIWRRP